MKWTGKQNNFAEGGYSLFLWTILILVFYSIYGFGPFTDMQKKIEQKNKMIELQKTILVDWAVGGPEHCFWQNVSSCSKHKTRFAKVNTLPTRALVSYPGSGNTWVRYLIEGATGVYTGSIFNDRSILRAGHYGEGRDYKDGSTILQKTHHRSLYIEKYTGYDRKWRETHVAAFNGKAVMVIRNPYKAILSYWNFFNTKSHTNVISEGSFESSKFKDFIFTGASRWLELIEDWLSLGKSIYIIFYEELVDDPVGEMKKLLEHLNLSVDEGRLSCISQHLSGTFHRKVHQAKDPFNQDHHHVLDRVIEKAGMIIAQNTGRKLPVERYEFYQEP